MSKGKPSSTGFTPTEVEGFQRQANRMNNPNVNNYWGSTTTAFGPDDQATITQTLSPEMQTLIGNQMDFVGQGPQQLGDYSNPAIEGMFNNFAGSVNSRAGFNPVPAMGGGAPNPALSFGTNMPNKPMPVPEKEPRWRQALSMALGGNEGSTGNTYNQAGQEMAALLQRLGRS